MQMYLYMCGLIQQQEYFRRGGVMGNAKLVLESGGWRSTVRRRYYFQMR